MGEVEGLARAGSLPDAVITDGVLKITPLDNQEPEEAEGRSRQAFGILPRIKITDLRVEVDESCSGTRSTRSGRSGRFGRGAPRSRRQSSPTSRRSSGSPST